MDNQSALNIFSKSDRCIVLWAVAALFLIRFFALWGQTELVVLPDEGGYLAQARYFAGAVTTPNFREFMDYSFAGTEREPLPGSDRWPYYHFGYSLLVAPAYTVFRDAGTAHQAVVTINCLLAACIFPALFFFARALGAQQKRATLVATIASVYPAYTYQAHIGWAENALPLVFALCCLLWLQYRKAPTASRLVLFSTLSAFAYTLHPRGIAISMAAVALMGCLFWLQPKHRKRLASGIVIVAAGVLYSKLKSSELAYLMSAAEQGNAVLNKTQSYRALFSLPVALGQFIYLFLASLGIFAFASVVLLRKVASQATSGFTQLVLDPRASTFGFVLLSAILSSGASVYFLSGSGGFFDFDGIIRYYLYGRYNESVMGVFLVLGLLWLADEKTAPNANVLRAGLGVLSTLTMVFWWLARHAEAGVSSVHSSSLFPWQNIAGGQREDIMLATTLFPPLIWTWLLLELYLRHRAQALWVSGAYFALMSLSLVIYINPNMQVLG